MLTPLTGKSVNYAVSEFSPRAHLRPRSGCGGQHRPGGAATAIRAVADGGRLATITSDPPRPSSPARISGSALLPVPVNLIVLRVS